MPCRTVALDNGDEIEVTAVGAAFEIYTRSPKERTRAIGGPRGGYRKRWDPGCEQKGGIQGVNLLCQHNAVGDCRRLEDRPCPVLPPPHLSPQTGDDPRDPHCWGAQQQARRPPAGPPLSAPRWACGGTPSTSLFQGLLLGHRAWRRRGPHECTRGTECCSSQAHYTDLLDSYI